MADAQPAVVVTLSNGYQVLLSTDGIEGKSDGYNNELSASPKEAHQLAIEILKYVESKR